VASNDGRVDPAGLGHRIRRARERKRWSQRELAAAIGVGTRSVGRWERGEAVPRNAIGALEHVLGISLEEDAEELDENEEVIRAMFWLSPEEQDVLLAQYRQRRQQRAAG
jgi:transcriptional regulator with XRE-family HTH domain